MAFSLSPRQPLPKSGEYIIPRAGVRPGALPLEECRACTASGRLEATTTHPPHPPRGPLSAHRRSNISSPILLPTEMADTLLDKNSVVYRTATALGVLTPRSRPEVTMAMAPSIASCNNSRLTLYSSQATADTIAAEPDDCLFCSGRDPYGKGADFLEKLSIQDHAPVLPAAVPLLKLKGAEPHSANPSAAARDTTPSTPSPRFGARPPSAKQLREAERRGPKRVPLEDRVSLLQQQLSTRTAGRFRPTLYSGPPPLPLAQKLAPPSPLFPTTPSAALMSEDEQEPQHLLYSTANNRPASASPSATLRGGGLDQTWNSLLGGTRGRSAFGARSPTPPSQVLTSRPSSPYSNLTHRSAHKNKKGFTNVSFTHRHLQVSPRRKQIFT